MIISRIFLSDSGFRLLHSCLFAPLKSENRGCPVRCLLKEIIVGLAPSVMVVEHLEGTLLLPFTRLHHQLKLVNGFRRCLYC